MTREFYHRDIFGTVVDVDLTEVQALEPAEAESKGKFNPFQITDAVGARDRKRAWILYRQALAVGLSAEEIFFKIVWQVNSMLIASRTRSLAETDMKGFSYFKAKSFLKNFQWGELEELSERLVVGYSKARQGEGEIETLVERTLLGL